MDNIILSLLLLKSMTIYEIRKFIQQNLSTVCSDSTGSIQAALKKLLAKKLIEVHSYHANGLTKKEYRITKEGLSVFLAWIAQPMDLHKVHNMEEGKFFFLGMAPKAVRISSLKSYLISLSAALEKLLQIKAYVEATKADAVQSNVARIKQEPLLASQLLSVSGAKDLEEAVQNIYDYQIYSLEYGLTRVREDLSFYQEILHREEEKKEEHT